MSLKEEQKQHLIDLMNRETLEEVVENTFGLVDPILGKSDYRIGFESGLIKGAKWQAQRMYSEEEVNFIIAEVWNSYEDNEDDETFTQMRKRVLEQFKKQ